MATADMKQQVNFTSPTAANGNTTPGWDFASTWIMTNGTTYPQLRPCCVADTTVAPSTVALPAARAIVAPVLPAVVVPPPVVVLPPDPVVPPVVIPPAVPVVPPSAPVIPPVVVAPVVIAPVVVSPPVVPPTPVGAQSPVVEPAGIVPGPVASSFNGFLPLVSSTGTGRFAWNGMQSTPGAEVTPNPGQSNWVRPTMALYVAPATGMVSSLYVNGEPALSGNAGEAPYSGSSRYGAPDASSAPYGPADAGAAPASAAGAGGPYAVGAPMLAPVLGPVLYVAPYRKPKQDRH